MKDLNIPYIAGLVIRAQHSDSDAFAELYALTYNKVYNYTRHYLRDDFLAQDAGGLHTGFEKHQKTE